MKDIQDQVYHSDHQSKDQMTTIQVINDEIEQDLRSEYK